MKYSKNETKKDSRSTKKNVKNDSNKIQDLENAVKRCQADFVNYKKRVTDERMDMIKYSGTNELLLLLPVFDNFTRAFQHIPENLKENEWVQGIFHINQHFLDVLKDIKIKKIECIGKPVDINLHDIVQQVPGKKDVIINVLEEGYMYHDKVLRHAKVIVGDGTDK